MEPIDDFYCKPENEEEAREIVERAVAHGALIYKSVEQVKDKYGWNDRAYWGVLDGETMTGWFMFEHSESEHLTLDQLRRRAPLVSELPDYNRRAVQEDEYYLACAISEYSWYVCRRALYFAGELESTDAPGAQPDAAIAELDAREEDVVEAYRQDALTLSEEARAALDSFDPVPGGLPKAINGSKCTPVDSEQIPVQSSRGAGLKFDGGKPQMRLLPPVAMLEMAKVMTFGAEKYEADSWRQVEGAKERYLDALGRHYNAWCRGEKVDDESGLSHMAHIMCNAAFLLELEQEVTE